MLLPKNEIIKIENYEYLFLNSLSKNIGEYNNFEKDSEDIVSNLSNRNFGILFPHYWSHKQVKRFGEEYEVSIDDYSWYLNLLKKYVLSDKLDFLDRINLFHCFGFTRYFEKEEKQFLISDILGYKLGKNLALNSLSNISAFTLLSFMNEFESKDLIPYLKKMKSNPQLLEFYAKYQIYYYGGMKNCFDQLQEYQLAGDIRSNVIPQTLLALKITEQIVNFDEMTEYRYEYESLYEKLPNNIKQCI